MPEADHHEVFEEKHYTPAELAELWGVSDDTIRRVFADEPGVLILQSSGGRKNVRPYKTIRIPASVAARVHQKYCTAPRILDHRRRSMPAK
jgi:DeoR/GlpR family transcriptional regulator of sugar metabolism